MKLYTSYFANVRQLQEKGFYNLWCVAGYAPKFFHDMPNAHFMPELAPKKLWWQEWHDRKLGEDWYAQKYNETVLSKLNPEKVVEELGDGAVLLCYEKSGDFCHRHLIADWIVKNTGVKVEEIQFPKGLLRSNKFD